MRVVIQRVNKAEVRVEGKSIGQINRGVVIFLAVKTGDGEEGIGKLAEKILKMRIFANAAEKFDKSILEIKGEILVIPQFTLYADCSGGNRPFFGQSARPEIAEPLFEKLVAELKKSGLKVEKGRFGAKMEVELINNGPVTIILDSDG